MLLATGLRAAPLLYLRVEPGVSYVTGVLPAALVDGFHRCMVVAAALVALGGVVAFALVASSVLSGPAPDGGEPHDERDPCHHCGVAGPPLVVSAD